MSRIPYLSASLLLTSSLAFVPVPGSAQNAAVVNGQSIPSSRVDAFVKAMVAQGRPETPDLRRSIREELIARELFVQEAEARKLPADPDVENRILRARQDILISALIRNELAANPVTDEQIKAEYERISKEQTAQQEYRASHILLEDEAAARKVIEQLDGGAKFAELASQSKDPGSAAKGGDLDWSTPSTFAPEFSAAMTALEKGRYTKEPVKTQFGYHVILLTDTRAGQPPAMESVTPQIRQQLERNRVTELQAALREKAVIK